MSKKIEISTEYFQQYRQKLGFTNQSNVKNFFGAKDISPTVDFNYIKLLNKRLCDIVEKINAVVVDDVKVDDLTAFKKEHIDRSFVIMKKKVVF